MQYDILTIFPHIFDSYLNESIIKRARKKGLIKVIIHDIREFTNDKHKTVDDRPYGGGPGMVMKIEPLYRCLKSIKLKKKSKILLLSAKGRLFTQRLAQSYSKLGQIVLICGHYEGIDDRIKKYVDGEISVGQYVLTGGEIPALAILDAVTRLLPGALGDKKSAAEETFSNSLSYKEYPHYTRPENFKGQKVPKVLLSGNHRQIASWRASASKE